MLLAFRDTALLISREFSTSAEERVVACAPRIDQPQGKGTSAVVSLTTSTTLANLEFPRCLQARARAVIRAPAPSASNLRPLLRATVAPPILCLRVREVASADQALQLKHGEDADDDAAESDDGEGEVRPRRDRQARGPGGGAGTAVRAAEARTFAPAARRGGRTRLGRRRVVWRRRVARALFGPFCHRESAGGSVRKGRWGHDIQRARNHFSVFKDYDHIGHIHGQICRLPATESLDFVSVNQDWWFAGSESAADSAGSKKCAVQRARIRLTVIVTRAREGRLR